MIKIGTDFSGIGAPEQALIKLGINHKCVFACDYDKYAKQSYLLNYNPDIFYDDITKRNHKETPYVDLYVAGFPCQAFSIAGKRLGFDDTRGTLFFDLLQYLKEKRPKYFILENVKGLLSHDKGRTFQIILDCLAKTVNKQYFLTPPENLGYHVYYKVLNTKHYGIPQNRERIFIVGFRDDKHTFNFPKKTPLELKLKDMLEDNVDEKFYLKEHTVKKLEEYTKRNKEKGNGFGTKFHNTEKDVMSSLKVGGSGADDLIITHALYSRSSKTGKGGSGPLNKKDGTSYCIDTQNSQAIEIIGGALRTFPRTRDPKKDKEDGRSKRVELRKDGLANSITTHHLDSIIQVGNIVDTGNFDNPQRGRIYDPDGISPALNTCTGGGLEPKIIDVHGTITGAIGRAGSSSEYLSSCNAVSSNTKIIRRLTPLECLRLQGFPDEVYHKCKEGGLSDTQLYKQAGNSMTVDVMASIIKEILINEKNK